MRDHVQHPFYVAGNRGTGKMTGPRILTVGHSNHALEQFLALVEGAGVSVIADVRSKPVSRWVPHFSRVALQAALAARGISYLFLGARARGASPTIPR